MENRRCRAVNPLSRGVTATPKRTAILEAVRRAEGLTNAYESITVPEHLRKSIAQKESDSSDPFEGGVAQLGERSLLAVLTRYGKALECTVVDQP
jgi:hypothetical protein